MKQPTRAVVIVRRLFAGVVFAPLIATTYLVLCLALIAFGAEPHATAAGMFIQGLWFGAGLSLMFALAPLFDSRYKKKKYAVPYHQYYKSPK